MPSSKYSKRRESFEKKEEKVSSASKNGVSSAGKEDRCDFCLLTGECNRKGEPEQLLVCKDCQAKGELYFLVAVILCTSVYRASY